MYAVTAAVMATAFALAPSAGTVVGPTSAHHARVVIVAVPDLRWSDVEAMPRLHAWMATAAAADLSVKTAQGTPRCADGELTFSAGDRANARPPQTGCTLAPEQFRESRAAAKASSFGAEPGALGDALHRAGLRTAATSAAARSLLADATGDVDGITDLGDALKVADVVAVVDDQIYSAPAAERTAAAKGLDPILAGQLAQVPAGATVIVAGISDGQAPPMHLHALAIRGPGWRHAALRSASTRAPFVQLRDLAPTVLDALHVPVPDVMVGSPARATDKAVATPASYADDDDHAFTARGVGQPLRVVFAYAAVAVVLLWVLGRWWPLAWPLAAGLGAIAVAAPIGAFLLQLLPWWRWPSWIYGVLVGVVGLVVGLVILAVRGRSRLAALLIGPTLTAAVLIADQFAQAPLQMSAPLGDNPIVAGRFHGMGNTAFALMATSVVLCAACIAARLGGRRGLSAAAALCVLAVVVDAAPFLGDDFGGLLALVPTVALLLVLVAGVRLTSRRVLIGAVGVVVVVGLVAFADYARPRNQQTHVGRFVGQVLHGGAANVIHRKLDSSLATFANSPALTVALCVAIALLVADRRRLWAALGRIEGLRPAALALVPLTVLGTFLNDSGVVVGIAVVVIAVLAIAAAGVFAPDEPVREPAGDHEEVVGQGSVP